ncbi:small nuclear ribonucleoprotein Sm D3, putative [Plasmodium knowlesi strain H]|uniref:Small nuclear ribonucleoprotein Sm D3 n=3 Tax=Plasmodium knowlesi TaxID=5850 RepID=A0A5K1UD98_PLAKH|nr:small nuclear ribonucleoprotein Sm D3, putative [Plasmodium knowlesi strain H]OTN67497.1 putative Small nuclear ribonucleoprotein Sm D3 [Plasmodium knowlesi]CAA9987368.1 small nuclear ribonucleoprotein Sm D3, putative [Plasmodium knowlesi strain H]SBO23341.1 small nuclear ribonucleoprotein Sm D3, putative [Plasmodium knowlesi strain H]SBO24468.1 small nuclear ribonucleoprotein Sm D3, putative [Plasmodium knowlesi strain H]VVS76842.1 small nuclear ribonucleoprotein Sm D3, putative [Plasmodiu|eukprot:XP_002258371.1 small nuclear ribonucleoprotein, putative [Plasmodium knowlesi strain H]
MSVGIPIKLLHEGIGHTISVETKAGVLYRGTLLFAEDNMNCLLENVSVIKKDGKQILLEQVYIRGGSVSFMIFPDMLRYAPIFKVNKTKTKTNFATIRRAMEVHAKMATKNREGRA